MKLNEEQVKRLLSLKRHEKPPEDHLEGCVRAFHLRCREESLRNDRRGSPWQRWTAWLAEPGPAKWIYATGVAYAVVLGVVVLLPRESEVPAPPALRPVSHPVTVPSGEAPPAQLEQLDLRPSSEGRVGEQEF